MQSSYDEVVHWDPPSPIRDRVLNSGLTQYCFHAILTDQDAKSNLVLVLIADYIPQQGRLESQL